MDECNFPQSALNGSSFSGGGVPFKTTVPEMPAVEWAPDSGAAASFDLPGSSSAFIGLELELAASCGGILSEPGFSFFEQADKNPKAVEAQIKTAHEMFVRFIAELYFARGNFAIVRRSSPPVLILCK